MSMTLIKLSNSLCLLCPCQLEKYLLQALAYLSEQKYTFWFLFGGWREQNSVPELQQTPAVYLFEKWACAEPLQLGPVDHTS